MAMFGEKENDTNKRLSELEKTVDLLVKKPVLPDHYHNKIDSSPVFWADLASRKVYIHHTIAGLAAATATNYGVFFIAPFPCYLSLLKEVHQTAGSDGGAVTLTLEKLTGTQALDAGTAMLSTTLSLKATADTVQTGTISPTLTSINLASGDRIAMKDAGTLTSVANVTVLLELTLS